MRRPDMVRRLAAVFHRDGWAEGVLDHDETPPDLCNQIIARFRTEDPVLTLAPIRRRSSPAGRE